VADQPSAGLLDSFAIGAQRRSGDVLVVVDGNIHFVEGPDQFVRHGVGASEELVQNGGRTYASAALII
jgi:hypothetical protein